MILYHAVYNNIKNIFTKNKILTLGMKYCNNYKIIQLYIILLTNILPMLEYILFEIKRCIININNTVKYQLIKSLLTKIYFN